MGDRSHNRKSAFLWATCLSLCFGFAIATLLWRPAHSVAAPPTILTYQGKLLESGTAVTTTQSMQFRIYNAAAGGQLVYTASGTVGVPLAVSVTPSSGIFAVEIGNTAASPSTNALDPDIFTTSSELYLEVRIGATTLSPRKRLTTVPFALNSRYLMGLPADTASTTQYVPYSDSNGNFTFSGDPQDNFASGGSVYINPTAADADETLFGIALGGFERFRVDEDGDTSITGNLAVDTDTLFVDATTERVGINSSSPMYPLSVSGRAIITNTSTILGDLLIGAFSENITTSGFQLTGDDAFFADDVGVKGDVYVENELHIGTTSLHFSGAQNNGAITMASGPLTIDVISGALNLNTDNNQNVVIGSGNFGINSSSPGFPLTVNGSSWFSATATLPGLIIGEGGAGGSITLNGSTISSWPGGGGDVTAAGDNAFTGVNTFAATSTFNATTSVNGHFAVDTEVLYVNSNQNKVGINTSSHGQDFAVEGTTLLEGTVSIRSTFPSFEELDVRVPADLNGMLLNADQRASINIANLDSSSIVVNDTYAYVLSAPIVGESTLEIFNITDPDTPSEIVELDQSQIAGASFSNPTGVAYANGYLYVAAFITDELEIFDVSDPSQPTFVAQVTDTDIPLDGAIDIAIQGKYLYLAARNDDVVHIINIEDPHDPTPIASITHLAEATALDGPDTIVVQDNRLYVGSVGSDSLSIFDISDPTAPTELGTILDGDPTKLGNPNKLLVQDGFAFVMSTADDALEVVNISSSTNPVHVTSLADGAGASPFLSDMGDMVLVGNYLLITNNAATDRVQIVDVTDPTSPSAAAYYESGAGDVGNFTDPEIIVAANGYVYLGGSSLYILDIGQNALPSVRTGVAEIVQIENTGLARFMGNAEFYNGLTVNSNGLVVNGIMTIGPSGRASTAGSSTLHFARSAHFVSAVSSTAATTNDYAFVFDTKNTLAVSSTSYLLSVRNAGTPVFSVFADGDVHATGTYHGFAMNVATPGAPGDLAERVDVSPEEMVEPGDVLVVDPTETDRYRKSTLPYASTVAGVVSTRPTITIGSGRTEHTAVMAMVGRVPVKVSTENGPIARGDLLVTAATPGHAMRYNPESDDGGVAVGVLGIALEPLAEGEGLIMGLVRSGWMNTRHQTLAEMQQDLAAIANEVGVEIRAEMQQLNVVERNGKLAAQEGDVNLNGFYIRNVAGLIGKHNAWQIDAQGRFVTNVETSNGQKAIYALQSADTEYVISGSGRLSDGYARIVFDQETRDIIDPKKEMKVSITLTSDAKGVYVHEKSASGFVVKEVRNGDAEASFDWVVIAHRRLEGDVAPVEEAPEDVPAEENPPVEEPVPEPAPVADPPAEEDQRAEEPAPEEQIEEPALVEEPEEEPVPVVEDPNAVAPIEEGEEEQEEAPVDEDPIEEPVDEPAQQDVQEPEDNVAPEPVPAVEPQPQQEQQPEPEPQPEPELDPVPELVQEPEPAAEAAPEAL